MTVTVVPPAATVVAAAAFAHVPPTVVFATRRFDGSVSTKLEIVSPRKMGLVKVNVRDTVTPPSPIVVGEKLLVSCRGSPKGRPRTASRAIGDSEGGRIWRMPAAAGASPWR